MSASTSIWTRSKHAPSIVSVIYFTFDHLVSSSQLINASTHLHIFVQKRGTWDFCKYADTDRQIGSAIGISCIYMWVGSTCYFPPLPHTHHLLSIDLRLQLLEPDRYPYLFKCLYGILMLLPQSSAFSTLRNRLSSVSSLGFLNVMPKRYSLFTYTCV
jgi:hypothetical protein